MKHLLKKLLPSPLILFYHKLLAIFANIVYGFPSRHLKVIGVTGTNGKTTTCNLLWQILTYAGYKVGLTSSINFKIGEREWVNKTKQGMQGRFRLQKLLRQMAREGCQYAVIETTSEGIKQYRHLGILYDVAVFTNLTSEHIEAHGSFENYKKAKAELFKALKKPFGLRLIGLFGGANKNKDKKVSVVNGDDLHAEYFLSFGADEKWVIKIKNLELKIKNYNPKLKILRVIDYCLTNKGATFTVENEDQRFDIKTSLLGIFNIYNCAAAIAVALSQEVEIRVIQEALEKVKGIPGRMEIIYDQKRDITVVVDYAHDPAALEAVYETIYEGQGTRDKGRLIAALGAVGGGRDKAKRPILGELASKYAAYVIITNEDPYDDDPIQIMEQVEQGVKKDQHRELNKNYWKILDRREAIKKAIELAQAGDIITLTGKGAEEVMAVKGGFIDWDDRKVVKEILDIF